MHAVAPGAGRSRREGRRHVPLRRDRRPDRAPARRRRRGPRRAPGRRRGRPGRRRRRQPRPAGRLPRAAPRRGRCRGWPARATTRPRARSGSPASRGELPAGAAHHNIHFGARVGRAFEALLEDGRRHARPVDPRHRPTRIRPVAGAGRRLDALRPRAGAEPRRHASTGSDERDRVRDTTGRAGALRSATPSTTSRSSASSTRATGSAGHGAGHARSPWPTASSRPGRSGPATSTASAPGLVFVGSGTVPGVGVPMVLLSGPAGRRAGGRAGDDGDRCTLEESYAALPAAEQALRHDVLLVDLPAARGEAPPRARPLRVLPLRRRHRRRPGPGPRAERASGALTDFGDRFFADLDAGRSDDPVLKAVVHTVQGLRHRSRVLPPVPAVDGHGPDRRRRTRRGTTCSATWTARPR